MTVSRRTHTCTVTVMHPLSLRFVFVWSAKHEHRTHRIEDAKHERKNGMRVAIVSRKIECDVLSR